MYEMKGTAVEKADKCLEAAEYNRDAWYKGRDRTLRTLAARQLGVAMRIVTSEVLRSLPAELRSDAKILWKGTAEAAEYVAENRWYMSQTIMYDLHAIRETASALVQRLDVLASQNQEIISQNQQIIALLQAQGGNK